MEKFLPKVVFYIRRIGRTISENFTEFTQKTALHGFRYIGNRRLSLWERLFFLSSFMIIMSYVIVLCVEIYAKWESTPVIVGFSPSPVLVTRLPFPSVTICNVNQARASKVQNFSRTSLEYSMLQTLCSRSVDDVKTSEMQDIKNRSTFQKFIEESAQPCERLLLSCRFGTVPKKCEDIFKPVLTDEGQCCVFNSLHPSYIYRNQMSSEHLVKDDGHLGVDWDIENGYQAHLPELFYPRVAAGVGIDLGLSIVINAEVDDYYCTSTNGPGFKLLLHNPIETPTLRENGLFVQGGAEMTFRIAADRSEAANDIRGFSIADRQCVFQSERRLAHFKTYTRANCQVECMANMTAKLCGCIAYSLPNTWPNVSVCTLKDRKCIAPILFPTPEITAKTRVPNCKDLCMQGCFDLSFTPARFTIPLRSGRYMIKNQMLEKFNSTYLRKNIAVAHFYYKLSNFDGYMRTRYVGATEFMSNLGGLIGLLGFSFILVAEVLCYSVLKPLRPVFSWIWNLRLKGRKKTKVKVVRVNARDSDDRRRMGKYWGKNFYGSR